jgi:hypothetical protein
MAGEELPYYLKEAENRNRRFNREYDDPLHLKYPKYEYKPDKVQSPEPDQELTLINQDSKPHHRVSVPQQISSGPVQYVYHHGKVYAVPPPSPPALLLQQPGTGREYYVPPSPPALLLHQPGTGREYYVLPGTPPPGPYSSSKQVVTLQDGRQYLVPASENSSTNRMVATLPNGQQYFVPEQSLYAASSGLAHHQQLNNPSEAVFYLNYDANTKRGIETRRLPIEPSGQLTINSILRPARSVPFADGHPIRMKTAETEIFHTAGSSDPRALPSQTAIRRRAPRLLPQDVGTSDNIIPSSRSSFPAPPGRTGEERHVSRWDLDFDPDSRRFYAGALVNRPSQRSMSRKADRYPDSPHANRPPPPLRGTPRVITHSSATAPEPILQQYEDNLVLPSLDALRLTPARL